MSGDSRDQQRAIDSTPFALSGYGDSWPDEAAPHAGRWAAWKSDTRSTADTLPRRPEVMSEVIAGLEIPETAAVAEATRLIQETTSPLIYHHSRRVFFFSLIHAQQARREAGPGAALPGGHVPRHRPPDALFRRRAALRSRWRRPRAQVPPGPGFLDGRRRDRLDGDRAAHHAGHPRPDGPGDRDHAPRRPDRRARLRPGRAGRTISWARSSPSTRGGTSRTSFCAPTSTGSRTAPKPRTAP